MPANSTQGFTLIKNRQCGSQNVFEIRFQFTEFATGHSWNILFHNPYYVIVLPNQT